MFVGQNITVQRLLSVPNTSLDEGDGIVEMVIDVKNAAVNVFSHQTMSDLSDALAVLENNSDISGLLIRSAKPAFIAGADIKEFAPIFSQGPEKIAELLARSNHNFNRLESLPYPVVVAINGFALGGGCEFALACDYRIASEDAKLGLPETRLGIIPGWGGSVRLPRIAGIETAVEWIATAREQSASKALHVGVVDGVVAIDALVASSIHVLQRCIDGTLDYCQRRAQKQSPLRHNSTELTMAFMTCKAMVGAQAGKHYPAPLAAVRSIERSAGLSLVDALRVESETFIKMAQTPVALALAGIFLSDQLVAKKAKQLAKLAPAPVQKAAVIGAGIMGGGIAYQSALKGVPVKLKDVQQSGIDLGLAEAKKLLTKRVEKGRLSLSDMVDTLNRIEPSLTYEGFDTVDIVVEAVIENPQIKQQVLCELEGAVRPNTVIASNTSTISIDVLAQSLARPQNFCGMHFFNPVHAMPLVEVIRGKQTSDETISATVAYANAMGKKAVVVNDCPGFLVNRVLFPYLAGFSLLLRDGADFQRIDKVMEAWGWPMGPAYLLDVVGIDTATHAESVMAEGFPERMGRHYTSAVDLLFKEKHFGQKTGRGFYSYEMDKKGKPKKHVLKETYTLINSGAQVSNLELTDDDIVARMMIPMATELARCLEEGIVASPSEADMALVYGVGFPPFLGGVFRWLDHLGIDVFCRMAEKYQHLGALYSVTDGVKLMQTQKKTYYSVEEV